MEKNPTLNIINKYISHRYILDTSFVMVWIFHVFYIIKINFEQGVQFFFKFPSGKI